MTIEQKPDQKEMKVMSLALRKAFISPRGIFTNYLSCLSQQDKSRLEELHREYGQHRWYSLKKFAEKIRKGEYEYRLFIK
jgi:hypothetical protein